MIANLDVLQAFRQFKIAMTDHSKRSLRERRVPKNFDSENEDHDPWGYAKPTYSRPASQQELRNPALQLNSDSRLLVQFLSSVNKRLKQYVAANVKADAGETKEPASQRERKTRVLEGGSEPQRRQGEGRQAKIGQLRASKDSHSNRAQINGTPISYSKNDSLLTQFKALNAESAHKMLNIENSLKIKHPPDSAHSRLQTIKQSAQLDPSSNSKKPQVAPKNGARTTQQLPVQGSHFALKNESGKKEEAANGSSKGSKSSLGENKIFKRSAYHVAIAYHIYLKKMREKGVQGNEIDPTYYARKLRESMSK